MQIALPAVVCALALPLGAQQVFIVDQAGGPGVYPGVQAALDAGADDGDVILVREGIYYGFAIQGQGVSVVADAGATPTFVSYSLYFGDPGFAISGLEADEAVVLRGLAFTQTILDPDPNTLVDVGAGGTVLMEECTLRDGDPSLHVGPGAKVALERCMVEGIDGNSGTAFWFVTPGVGIDVEGEATLSSTRVIGGEGWGGSLSWSHPTDGRDAAWVKGAGVLALRNSLLEGGPGGDGSYEGFCGEADGGPALHLAAGAPVARLVGTTLTGGEPGIYASCPGLPGPSVLQEAGVLEDLAGPTADFGVEGVVREGQTHQGVVRGEPGALAFLAVGPAPAPAYLPSLQGMLLAGAPQQFLVLGIIPGDGSLPISAAVGELGPGVSAVQLMLQAATCGTSSCALGAGSHAVLLDAAY